MKFANIHNHNFYDTMLAAARRCGCEGSGNVGTPRLRVDKDSGIITAGQYEIHVQQNKVRVKDTETGKWIEAWGDPHFKTSDGDKAQFHNKNLTIDLPNGVKLTIVPTEQESDGAPTYVDQVAVMTEDQSILVSDMHAGAPKFGPLEKATGALDRMHDDGTVLYVKDELDDLFFAANGRELEGTDRNARWGEHELDGIGGESLHDFASELGLPNLKGMDIYTILFIIMGKAEEQMYAAANELAVLQNKREERDQLLRENADTPGFELPEKLQGIDAEMSMVTSSIERLEQFKQQINTMMSNLSKSEHEMKMVSLRNIPTR